MLFDELMSNPRTTSKGLKKKYELTRRQLGYSFDKINDWLKVKSLPVIERTSQGHFIIDHSIFSNYSNEKVVDSSDRNIVSETQRVYMIILMLISKRRIFHLFILRVN